MNVSIQNRNLTYFSIADELPHRKRRVFNAFLRLGKATNIQVAKTLQLSINQVTGRTKELRDLFLLKESGKQEFCGHNHTVYEPIKDDKKRASLIEQELIDLRLKLYRMENDLNLEISDESKVILRIKIKALKKRINDLTKVQN